MSAGDLDRALGASYRLLELIGRGAAGEVWRAVDRRSGETVAAKLLRREHVEDEALVARFLRERSILTKLRNPNVVAVRDLVVDGGQLAIVMEYVDGGTLREVVAADGPLPPELALGVTAAVLDGLEAAHEAGVLHRDVKPDNVLLSGRWRELGPGALKVSDFGISQLLADRAGSTTGLVGTPEYMAPEQLVTGTADPPADVYGAGVLLYELLAGRTPFAGAGTGYSIAHRHVTSAPPQLPVPGDLWAVLLALLNKDPTARPSAREAAARLRAVRLEAELPALPRQEPPSGFASTGGPATEVRGLVVQPGRADPLGEDDAAERLPVPEVGAPGPATMLRAMPTVPGVAPVSPPPTEPARRRPFWRDPRAIALIVVGALLVGGGIIWLTRGAATDNAPPTAAMAVRAQQQGITRPTGLGISRVATWEPQTGTARLTVTYTTERSPLAGPFLEVVPGPGGQGCPALIWSEDTAKLNPPSVTGLSTPCAWSVDPPPLPARSSIDVTATVPLTLPTGDPATVLQDWLDSVAAATEEATTDSEVASTAYSAQRLADVQVVAPSATVSGKTLKISLIPVWPSGADPLNPLFQSPPVGDPSSLLVAAAGGEAGVRFSDECSDALSISDDGLVVTALAVADQCQVGARVGNFTDLRSNEFTIATRGS